MRLQVVLLYKLFCVESSDPKNGALIRGGPSRLDYVNYFALFISKAKHMVQNKALYWNIEFTGLGIRKLFSISENWDVNFSPHEKRNSTGVRG